MFLKRVEIFGFKSFPEKTSFQFEQGVTAVVGPNGCGKSNVADAIKWVLGEQSAKSLRGANMHDVIFNGSDSMKPLSMAEVSLVLDNSQKVFPLDFNEITVTRRIYRSGEGEYLINKNICRLKDIVDLFMDTGLGADAYSVIEQGRMDAILKSTPAERRAVFEEAAGITKYKARRKEALRKLEKTEENLLRLTDILGEVKRNMGSIQRQAQKAQRYQTLMEELKNLDLRITQKEWNSVDEKLKTEEKSFAEITLKEQEFVNLISKEESKIQGKKMELLKLDEDLKVTHQELSNIYTNIQIYEKQISFDHNKLEEMKNREHIINNEIFILENKIKTLHDEVKQEDSNVLALTQELKNKEDEMNVKNQAASEIQQKINKKISEQRAVKEEHIKFINSETKIKGDVQYNVSINNHLREKAQKCVLELEAKNKNLSLIQENIKVLKTELDIKKANIVNLENQKKELVNLADQLISQQEKLAQELSQRKSEYSSKKAELDVLLDMKKRYEGYSKGVKELLQKRDSGENVLKSILTDVAAALTVESAYERAIEAALGDAVQSLIVNDRTGIASVLQYMKGKDFGKVAFFPVDVRQFEGNFYKDENCKPALSVVKYDEKYKTIFENIFSNIYIAEDLDSAMNIHQRVQHACTIVTMQGEMVSAQGAIIAGVASLKHSGLLTRDSKIKKLSETIELLDGIIKNSEQESLTLKENISANKKKLEDLIYKINEDNKLVYKDTHELSKLESNVEFTLKDVEKINKDKSEFDLEIEKNDQIILKNKEEFLILEQKLKEIKNILNEQNMGLSSLEKERDDFFRDVTNTKIAVASLKEKQTSAQARKERLNNQIREEIERKGKMGKELEDIAKKRVEINVEIQGLKDKSKEAEIRRDEIELKYNAFSTNKNKMTDENQMDEAYVRELRANYNVVQKESKTIELALNESKMHLENIKERVKEKYSLEMSAVVSMQFEELPPEMDAAQRMEEVKEKINSMGPVNLVAIEEFAELEKRHEFLTTQNDDLIKAKESLLNVITTINKESRKRFKEAFDQISENFKEIFKILFQGGKAELILLDELDLLECGIEIIACPPGKKPQSISLLSGGERALTGIALLFAMFRVKPSPFCVLDEIDSPLDEMNVQRFTRIIEEFKSKTQFVVITHNKRTMAMADVMYGVTMEKPGVSRIISVKMVEREGSLQIA